MDPTARFVELINRPAAEAHLDVLAALVGASFDAKGSVAAVVTGLDQLAARCEPNFDSIMSGLFASGHLRGNDDDYGDPRNSYLHDVLGRHVGLPITLSIVAMEVGRRLGCGIAGIGLPGHFLVRDDASDRYGDPFNAGMIYSVDEVGPAWQRLTRASDQLSPSMLAPTPARSIVLRMLNNLVNTFVQRDDANGLAVLARLRGAFPELANERETHARWLAHWN